MCSSILLTEVAVSISMDLYFTVWRHEWAATWNRRELWSWSCLFSAPYVCEQGKRTVLGSAGERWEREKHHQEKWKAKLAKDWKGCLWKDLHLQESSDGSSHLLGLLPNTHAAYHRILIYYADHQPSNHENRLSFFHVKINHNSVYFDILCRYSNYENSLFWLVKINKLRHDLYAYVSQF